MYNEILQELGLSPNEAKIYEALVQRGESSIGEITLVAKVHRRNAYDAMERLIEKGLCFEIFSPGENRYSPVDPGKLRELLAEKQHKLDNILPDLEKKFRQKVVGEEAYIYRGFEGQKNIWRDILRVGKDHYFIGGKGGWSDPRLDKAARERFFSECRRRNIKLHMLFDREVKEQLPHWPKNYPSKIDYRFLPKEYSSNSGVGIFGDYLWMYTRLTLGRTDENSVFFIIKSRDLAESYRKWFWYMWEQSEEPKKPSK